jgi:hypothetical protein
VDEQPLRKILLDQLLQRFFGLPRRDQLEFFESVREYLLAEDAAPELPQDKLLREQREALEAMARVAGALEVPEGTSPNSSQFGDIAPRVAPEWSTSRVVRAFGR